MTHHIRRQVLELELPQEAGALALQRQFVQVWQEKVLPKLDELFTQWAPEGQVIRIPRLELDLGQLNVNSWENQLIERCVEQFSRYLKDLYTEVGFTPDSSLQTLTSADNDLNVFGTFLASGNLPWYAAERSLKELEADLAPMFAAPSTTYTAQILPILQQEPFALRRLLWQFSAAFVEKVLASILNLKLSAFKQALDIWQKTGGNHWTLVKMEPLFQLLLTPRVISRLNQFTETSMIFEIWQTTLPSMPGTNTREEKQNYTSGTVPPISPKDSPPQATQAGADQAPLPSAAAAPPDYQVSGGVRVENAGLVLLAPYLPTLFQALGWLENDRFQQAELQHRAIHVLHYLATGEEHPEEPLLSLSKILCGQALEEPLPLELDLSEFEKQEAETLLEAVIQNWPALKNTGPNGLRSGFLQRMGILSSTNILSSWLLRIEQQGQDVLLERLPWGYSVIKLPWMEGSLQVEW